MHGTVHASSKNMNWETPQDLFNKLNEEFHFDLDVCATLETTKCPNFFSPEVDGLKQSWNGFTCWMNPPYGTEIGKWLKKAHEESNRHGITVVCLIPSRTDTSYWHHHVMQAKEIRVIKGRVRFVGAKENAPFPCAIVVFDGIHHSPIISTYELP